MNESRKVDLNKSEDKKLAKLFIDPATGSAITGHRFINSFGANGYVKEGDLMDYHIETDAAVVKGDLTELERMLTSQAIVLDQVFKGALNRSADNIGEYSKTSATYMNMALKAQSQCRCTIESINELQNPKSVTITKQANFADQQVVHNGGTMNTGSRAHGAENEDEPNELLSEVKHEKVDTRGATSPKRVNQTVEAVGTVNRRKNSKRKSQKLTERT